MREYRFLSIGLPLFGATALAAAMAAQVVSEPVERVALSSPRLERLRLALARSEAGALQGFWEEVDRTGAPLVEPGETDRERRVTFLWKSSDETRVVLLADFSDSIPHMTLVRLPGTDVWYRTLRLPA